ncbi:prevent-host-death family protein [Leifsonia sp. EB34]|uniref:prevent-host-death family protein n=1 Tax=Leifsonia sp. EB34 TaxID=3156303 RepID=UPI00351380DF
MPLNEVESAASTTQEDVDTMSTVRPAASVVSVQDRESLVETQYWLSQEQILDVVTAARSEIAKDGGITEDEIRNRFGS